MTHWRSHKEISSQQRHENWEKICYMTCPHDWYEMVKKFLPTIQFTQSKTSICSFKGNLLAIQPPLNLGLYLDDFFTLVNQWKDLKVSSKIHTGTICIKNNFFLRVKFIEQWPAFIDECENLTTKQFVHQISHSEVASKIISLKKSISICRQLSLASVV